MDMLTLALGCLPLSLHPAQEISPRALEQVDALFAPWDAFDEPGMAVGIIREGELIYAKGFGMANLELGHPNGPKVLYRIGSTSKQFTASAIALLALDGTLDLDAPLTRYFPELAFRAPGGDGEAPEEPVRVRNLVHHTSGIPDYIYIHFAEAESAKVWFSPAQTFELLDGLELEFVPGARYEYSNSNYFLMGLLVQVVSGRSLRDFARERIFEPLGMTETRFQDRHDEVILGRSHGYSLQEEPNRGKWRVDITHLDHVGDGGVFTTIEDLAKWDANFYGNRLDHGQAFLDLLLTRGVLSSGEEIPYAMGLIHGSHGGTPTVEHGGSWVGYLAQMIRFPERRLSVIVLANQTNVNPPLLATRVADICLAGVLDR